VAAFFDCLRLSSVPMLEDAEKDDGKPDHPDADSSGASFASAGKLTGLWSIGLYGGRSPLTLNPLPQVSNPVLTYQHVTDVSAAFVADPFMVCRGGAWYMFFEVFNAEKHRGEIGCAFSDDGLRWNYLQIVLREEFHLSYPCVFSSESTYYMIPETLALGSIHLYEAVHFPEAWSRVGTLIEGECADPTIFYRNGLWSLFACTNHRRHDTLSLFQATHLTGPWQEHPRSPIIKGSKRTGRPGGRVIQWDGRMIRYAQDCYPIYGSQVRALEITAMTADVYQEREVEESPILGAGFMNWNSLGMHHVDPHQIAPDQWIACVDGRSFR
jgi:hypothetical protein